MDRKPKFETTNVARVSETELRTSGRRAEIARRLMAGQKFPEIAAWLEKDFNLTMNQIKSEYRHGFTYIWINCDATKEDIRQLSLARLNDLYDRAEEELKGKDFFNVQLKNIDLVNKTTSLYAPEDSQINTTGEFTITFGGANKETKEDKDDTDN